MTFCSFPKNKRFLPYFFGINRPNWQTGINSPKLVSSDLLNPFHTGPKRTTFSDDQLGDQLGQPPKLGL